MSSAHSKPPFAHSYHRPITRIIINIVMGGTARSLLKKGKVKGTIMSSAISRSNIRNSIATMKKRKENGVRADFIGSNPHS